MPPKINWDSSGIEPSEHHRSKNENIVQMAKKYDIKLYGLPKKIINKSEYENLFRIMSAEYNKAYCKFCQYYMLVSYLDACIHKNNNELCYYGDNNEINEIARELGFSKIPVIPQTIKNEEEYKKLNEEITNLHTIVSQNYNDIKTLQDNISNNIHQLTKIYAKTHCDVEINDDNLIEDCDKNEDNELPKKEKDAHIEKNKEYIIEI
jgi:hypothetical protein